jgi:hypothetical protein
MTWACCEREWREGFEGVTERQTGKNKKENLDKENVELSLRTVGLIELENRSIEQNRSTGQNRSIEQNRSTGHNRSIDKPGVLDRTRAQDRTGAWTEQEYWTEQELY